MNLNTSQPICLGEVPRAELFAPSNIFDGGHEKAHELTEFDVLRAIEERLNGGKAYLGDESDLSPEAHIANQGVSVSNQIVPVMTIRTRNTAA